MLVHRDRPWDWSIEVVMDFAIEMSFFERTDTPYCVYYRLEGHPQFRAVADLVQAAHSSFISMLPIRPEMMTWDRIKAIHRQRCSEQQSAWSLTPPPCQAAQRRDTGRSGRRERQPSQLSQCAAKPAGKPSRGDHRLIIATLERSIASSRQTNK